MDLQPPFRDNVKAFIKALKAAGAKVKIETTGFMVNVNNNTILHKIGASYGVKKHKDDAPHWSFNGR